MNKDAVAEAVAELIGVVDGYTLADIGPHLTCGETEALANLYEAAGRSEAAAMLVEGHAAGDEPDDDHYDPEGEYKYTDRG